MAWKSSTENEQSKLRPTPGNAAGQTQRLAKPVIPEGTFVPDVDPFSMSTPASVMDQIETEPSVTSKPDTMSAPSTSRSGPALTVWTLSPLEFLNTTPEFSDEDLEELEPVTLRKLKQYTEGQGWPIGTSIVTILEFLMNGGMFDGERNVGESLAFYLENYWY